MAFTTKVFESNKSQAVRLPEALAFPVGTSEVSIVAVGTSRIIAPIDQSWDSWFGSVTVMDDFMLDRQQPKTQNRESFK